MLDTSGRTGDIMESDVVIQSEGDVGVELGDEVVLREPDDDLGVAVLVES